MRGAIIISAELLWPRWPHPACSVSSGKDNAALSFGINLLTRWIPTNRKKAEFSKSKPPTSWSNEDYNLQHIEHQPTGVNTGNTLKTWIIDKFEMWMTTFNAWVQLNGTSILVRCTAYMVIVTDLLTTNSQHTRIKTPIIKTILKNRSFYFSRTLKIIHQQNMDSL